MLAQQQPSAATLQAQQPLPVSSATATAERDALEAIGNILPAQHGPGRQLQQGTTAPATIIPDATAAAIMPAATAAEITALGAAATTSDRAVPSSGIIAAVASGLSCPATAASNVRTTSAGAAAVCNAATSASGTAMTGFCVDTAGVVELMTDSRGPPAAGVVTAARAARAAVTAGRAAPAAVTTIRAAPAAVATVRAAPAAVTAGRPASSIGRNSAVPIRSTYAVTGS